MQEISNPSIEIRDLNVSYTLRKSYSVKQSFFRFKKNEVKVIHAVKNLNLVVPQGEVLGIVGKNGSGKSTLLSTIAGILMPDSGEVDLHGHSISLLALGAGFNKEVTGRENIYLSGMLLGFSRRQIEERLEEIIAFSELGEFIEYPVKSYSSGMVSKLAFAITAILETDIILADEVLSVGDAKFRKKSYSKMRSLVENADRTAVIVSHQEATLRELCDRILWMHEGETRMLGPTNEVLDAYMKFME